MSIPIKEGDQFLAFDKDGNFLGLRSFPALNAASNLTDNSKVPLTRKITVNGETKTLENDIVFGNIVPPAHIDDFKLTTVVEDFPFNEKGYNGYSTLMQNIHPKLGIVGFSTIALSDLGERFIYMWNSQDGSKIVNKRIVFAKKGYDISGISGWMNDDGKIILITSIVNIAESDNYKKWESMFYQVIEADETTFTVDEPVYLDHKDEDEFLPMNHACKLANGKWMQGWYGYKRIAEGLRCTNYVLFSDENGMPVDRSVQTFQSLAKWNDPNDFNKGIDEENEISEPAFCKNGTGAMELLRVEKAARGFIQLYSDTPEIEGTWINQGITAYPVYNETAEPAELSNLEIDGKEIIAFTNSAASANKIFSTYALPEEIKTLGVKAWRFDDKEVAAIHEGEKTVYLSAFHPNGQEVGLLIAHTYFGANEAEVKLFLTPKIVG